MCPAGKRVCFGTKSAYMYVGFINAVYVHVHVYYIHNINVCTHVKFHDVHVYTCMYM